jgi:hypothetical protein
VRSSIVGVQAKALLPPVITKQYVVEALFENDDRALARIPVKTG